MIYFISGSQPGCQIGYTKNEDSLQNRIKSIQTGHPWKLKVLATCEGSHVLEKNIHRALLDYRLEGEWFDNNPFTLQFIADTELLNIERALDRCGLFEPKSSFFGRDFKIFALDGDKKTLSKMISALNADFFLNRTEVLRLLYKQMHWKSGQRIVLRKLFKQEETESHFLGVVARPSKFLPHLSDEGVNSLNIGFKPAQVRTIYRRNGMSSL